MPSQTPQPNINPLDDLAAQFKRYHQRITSLERAATGGTGSGGGGGTGTPATSVTTQAVGDAPVVGVSTKYAREDHKHGREAFGGTGTALTVAHSDHNHAGVYPPVSRLISTTAPLTGGGDLSADRTLAITNFAGSAPGAVPTSVGGTTNFLRADGTWASPPAPTVPPLVTDGDKGDITVGGSGTTLTIDPTVVTNAKLANMNQSRIKGRYSAGTGDPEDLTAPQVAAVLAGFVGRYYSTAFGGSTIQTITHNLNSFGVMAQVARNSAPFDTVECDVERTTLNTLTLRFSTAPTANQYFVVVIG